MSYLNRSVFAGVAAPIVLFLVACGQPSAVQSPAVPGPPVRPCVFPDVQELAALAAASDVVAVGTVVGGAQPVEYAGISATFTRYALRVQSVLRQKAIGTSATSGTLVIEEVGGVPVPILQPGPYVVFLVKSGQTDTLTTYFLADGLNGAFPLRSAGAYRECANYQSPANPIEASGSGQGMSQADFSNEVRSLAAIATPLPK